MEVPSNEPLNDLMRQLAEDAERMNRQYFFWENADLILLALILGALYFICFKLKDIEKLLKGKQEDKKQTYDFKPSTPPPSAQDRYNPDGTRRR